MPILVPENRYTTRLNHVLNFAHANIHNNIQLDRLADTACMSKYHFTRIFHDQVGESPIRFLKRIRLERAACLLSDLCPLPIVDIASKCGFSSNQLFSRTFGDKFGSCPSKFRSNHVFSLEHSKGQENIDLLYKEFRTIGIDRNSPSTFPQIEIVKRPPIKVAYVRSLGKYHSGNGRDTANSIRTWSRVNGLWTEETEIIGVTWDYSSITPDTMCRFDACIPIPDYFSNKSRISFQTIPGGLYAVMQAFYQLGENQRFFWRWFFLTLDTSPVFQKYKAEISGPWLEIYTPKIKEGKYFIELYARLHSRNA